MHFPKVSFSYRKVRAENVFKRSLMIAALIIVVLTIGIFITLIAQSIPSIRALGLKYLWGKTWDPVSNTYGAFPFLLGTLITSFLALVISIPFSFSIAVYLGEYNTKGWLPGFLKNIVEIIAAIPSV